MSESYRIAYFGLPLGALCLLRDGHALAAVCISRPEMPGMSRLRRLLAPLHVPLLAKPDLEDEATVTFLAATKPALLASWFWTKRIPAKVLALAPDAYGVHPSLLPRHRGADPYFWALARGDQETGVSAHRLTERYDEGAVLAQRTLAIAPQHNAWTLAKALDRPSLALFREMAQRFSRGDAPSGTAQDPSLATEAPAPADDDCELRWDWTVAQVLSRIRAAAPDPGAFTGFGDDTVVLLDARPAQKSYPSLEPGDVVRTEEGLVIRASDGAVVVTRARSEEDEESCTGELVLSLFPGVPRV